MYHIDSKDAQKTECAYGVEHLTDLNGNSPVGFAERLPVGMSMENGDQSVYFVKIPKHGICKSPYQRNVNHKTLESMREGIFYQALGAVVNVHEAYLGGKYYYTVLDGQHRCMANPADTVIGVVSNTIPEALAFCVANDKSAKRNCSTEDLFHAQSFIHGSIESRITNMIETKFNITIQRHPDHGSGKKKVLRSNEATYQWGATLKNCFDSIFSKVKKSHQKRVPYKNPQGKLSFMTETHATTETMESQSLNLLEEIVSLVVEVFGTDELRETKKSTNKTYWFLHLTKWLLNNFDLQIPFDQVKIALRSGHFAKTSRSNSPVYNLECGMSFKCLDDNAKRMGFELSKNAQKQQILSMIWNYYEITLKSNK